MTASNQTRQRPQRWSVPFGERMTDRDVDRLLGIEPFCFMDRDRFPARLPLHGLLKNDCRIVSFEDREIVLREGDYGHSAFLILSGEVEIALQSLPPALLGRPEQRRLTWWESLRQTWTRKDRIEFRRETAPEGSQIQWRSGEESPRVFLQDFPKLLGPDGRLALGTGEFFGELAALSRTPRTATVVSKGRCELLEIRWQGLRDLLKFDSALRTHIHQLYRENSLRVHLRETPLFKGLADDAIQELADETIFESYGEFDWHRRYRDQDALDVRERIELEPVIVQEGEYPDGLILIRSGFARMSRRYDDGHRTLEYLGKGRVFGIDELVFNWSHVEQTAWQSSLRALGYVDILRIPTSIVERHLLPQLAQQYPDLNVPGMPTRSDAAPIDSDLMEFMVEHRLLNATQALVIDLDRCTRCDDCLKACASTHDGNPRFRRQGPTHDHLMFAQACMHCQDPVCMIGCPTGAIGRAQSTGVVAINDLTCIGCGTCASSCPYQNIQMVETRNESNEPWLDPETKQPILKATKCDFCHQQPTSPACQNACPHDALVRIDLSHVDPLAKWLEGRNKGRAA